MTIAKRIEQIVNNSDVNMEQDSLEKLILMAYHIGLERGVSEALLKHNDLSEKQKERAEKCRYHNMANDIIGDTLIYDVNFRQDMTSTFGNDETKY